MRTASRVERRITSKCGAEIGDQIYEIGARENPILEIRERDETRRSDMSVRSLDDHISSWINIDARRMTRVRLE